MCSTLPNLCVENLPCNAVASFWQTAKNDMVLLTVIYFDSSDLGNGLNVRVYFLM